MDVHEGAEARVEINSEVLKKRKRKEYRHRQLDERIREKRTSKEAKLLKKAHRAGVKVPKVTGEDQFELQIEKIEGSDLKDCAGPEKMIKMGEEVAKLHEADIIHGDLTTSNAMADELEVFLIDLGLAFRSDRTEDKAVDLHLLRNILESSHEEYEELWNSFLEGYRGYCDSEEVERKLEEVEKRGRYK